MTLNTLSHLSKGYGSWTGGYVDPYFGEKVSCMNDRSTPFYFYHGPIENTL